MGIRQDTTMSTYQHQVSGFFVQREEAEMARDKLILLGLPPTSLAIFDNDRTSPSPAANINAALKGLLVNGAVVLVATTWSAQETQIATDLIQEAVGSCKDVATV